MKTGGARTTWLVAVGVAAAATAVLVPLAGTKDVPTGLTYGPLSEPQGPHDRAVIARYRGTKAVDLGNARALGEDDEGNSYLVVAADRSLCFVVIHSSEAMSGGCDPLDGAAGEPQWLEFGGRHGHRMAVLVPDEYRGAEIQASGRVLLQGENLVVLESTGDGSDTVRLVSDRHADLIVGPKS